LRNGCAKESRWRATHVIVVLDTFDYDAHPGFVMPVEDAREASAKPEEGYRVQEVYNLKGFQPAIF
jgi:hypothetical protein